MVTIYLIFVAIIWCVRVMLMLAYASVLATVWLLTAIVQVAVLVTEAVVGYLRRRKAEPAARTTV